MTRTYHVTCLSVTASPMTHMSGSSGNESIISREPIVSPRGVAMVPMLSGNAIRHRAVRAPGARWLVDTYDLVGKLTLVQLNWLFHGGNLTEGGGREDTRRIADMQRLWPLYRLLGGCLPDQVLAGSMDVGRGTLVCEENRATLGAILGTDGASVLPSALRPAEAFVSGYQYVRMAAERSAIAPLAKPRPEGVEAAAKSGMMPFSGQAVTRGAAFIHDFILKDVAEVELGALLWSLRLWQAQGGTVGGQAARGHGRLDASLVGADFDQDGAVGAYLDHARSVRDDAVAWLDAAFAKQVERAERKSPGRKAKGKTAEDVAPVPEGPDSPAPDEGFALGQ